MKVGVFGTGDVGRALGLAFIELGHEVKLGSRRAGGDKARAWAQEMGERGSEGTFADAADFGDLVVLATLGTANEQVLEQAGPERLAGKVVIDATNPLDFSGGMPPKLAVGHTDSGGEQVQRKLPEAKVVKAFNTVGNQLMFRPELPGGPPDMFICGNDDAAKQKVTELLTEFGWNTSDLGFIESSRYLEPLCLVWVLHGVASGSWNHAFKFLTQ